MPEMTHLLDEAVRIWKNASFPVALTGAGSSVPSGIPDFRSPDGLWTRFNPNRVATAQALRQNKREVWEFLLAADKLFTEAKPNPAHNALARLEDAGLLKAVITQNIDSLHQRAGSQSVIEFHGHAREYVCNECGKEHPPEQARALGPEDIPWLCDCGGLVRPKIVFFGEAIPHEAMLASEELLSHADLMIVAGTSGEVAPVNSFPYIVRDRGGAVIEINLGQTRFGDLSDVRFDAPAEEVLPALADRLIT
jgi:NAD-dependent deacetylase